MEEYDFLAVGGQQLLERHQETSIELRATKATAVFESIPSDPYDNNNNNNNNNNDFDGPPVYCECFGPISDLVARMATKPKD
jgi:hypothetical protein